MGYYCAWGDTKMICSSEEEGYENRVSNTREKRRDQVSGIFGEAPSTPAPLISDDTDRQFWAEDELSNSESRQRLIARRKRRHSASYRNRTANRSRSRVSHSSDSTSDSIHATTPPKVRKIRRCCRCQLKSKTDNLQFVNMEETNIEGTAHTINEISLECPVASFSGQKSICLCLKNQPAILSYENSEQVDDTMQNAKRIRRKRTCDHSKPKQK